MAKPDPTSRPDASGHRFGPNLKCDECGRTWDEHQHEPLPCESRREIRAREARVEAARQALAAVAASSEEIDD